MPTELYLDTARLGRMCNFARTAEQDFGRLVSQLGSSLYIERFLTHGFNALPSSLRRDVKHLDVWDGISGLKSQLRQFVGLPPTYPVLLASRSAHLMTLAAHALVSRCHNVMTTDADWPPFLAILHRVAKCTGRQVTEIPMRRFLVERASSPEQVTDSLVKSYRSNHCDGLFLSDVTYFGIRLPTREVLMRLGMSSTPPAFTVLDGAQATNHVPLKLTPAFCDLYLGGTHKWLQSYLPLSVGFCCTELSAELINETIAKCSRDGCFDDSLFNFCMAAESEDFQGFGETVNVTPLITAAAALAFAGEQPSGDRWETRQRNVLILIKLISKSPWTFKNSHRAMRTGALLLETNSAARRACTPNQLRLQFHRKRICLTAYASGLVRISVPAHALELEELKVIRLAFSR